MPEPKTTKKVKEKKKMKCWEVFQCEEEECPAYRSRNLKCWLFAETHCHNGTQGQFIEKMELCLHCKVFKNNIDVTSMKKTLITFHKQLNEYTNILVERDKELIDMSMELAIGLSEVFEALKKIASGDPSVRIDEKSEIDLISQLKQLINMTAREIGEIVDQSHEFAIGLAEHFDVLHRVIKGERDARVSGSSQIELLEAHKKITNEMIGSIFKAITNREQAEERLLKEKIFTDSMINSLPGVFYLFDSNGRYINWNKNLEQITGYSTEEIAKMSPLDFFASTEKKLVQQKIQEVFHKGEAIVEADLVSKKGQKTPYLFTGLHLMLDGQDYLVGMGIDITERIQIETTLKESEEKYSSLFHRSNDAIIIHDLEGNIIDINQKVVEQFGYSKAEILSLNIMNLHPKEAYDASQRAFKKISEDSFVNFEIDFEKKSGDIFTAEVSASLFEIAGKKVIQGIVRDITDRKRAVEQIIHMAYHDTLTNLPNRHLLKDRLKQALASAKQYDRQVAILFLDLDNFKLTNDTLGHDVGDLLLKEVSARLVRYIRESDSIARSATNELEPTIARFGGDEFTILLTEVSNIQDIAKVAQRIIDLFEMPFRINDQEIFITTSMGISLYPHDGNDADTILKNADTAMYHAKDIGRNNYQFFKESMNKTILDRLKFEKKIRKALDQNEFELYYQPLLNIKSGKIIGVEALIRWIDPEKGIVLPMQFIPLAEETGLIIPMGEWILHTACKQNKAWQDAGYEPIRLAVNISSVQFKQPHFVETVRKSLREANLEPHYLELELTESILMHDTEAVMNTLNEFKALGVRFSIDDFGTGYSSLSYLKRFPIDTLKIDRSFVRDLAKNPEDKAIINAIIALAHSLNLGVIAEGVETKQQLSFLHKQGSDGMQGFLFSPPIPAKSLTKLLKEGKYLEF